MCGLFGKTKQAYYKKEKSIYKQAVEASIIIEAVKKLRIDMPRLGTRKLHRKLSDQCISLGRDALFNLLRGNGLLIYRKRTRVYTTQSFHWFRKYPNLIKGLEVTGPNQLWVSDITYVETDQGFLYLFLITDAYSRKIVGFKAAENLEAINATEALQQALKGLPAQAHLIHHSDRGIQYCCNEYVKVLNKNNIDISMTQKGDPLENAIAERINGILKVEWLYDQKLDSFEQAKKYIRKIIGIYNAQRPHSSIDMLTPDQAHIKNGVLKRRWKNYYKSRINSNPILG